MSEMKCPKCGELIAEDSVVCPSCRYVVMQDEDDPDVGLIDDDETLSEGTVVAEDYRIVRLLGVGGAGAVYEARQISLQNVPVALKMLHPDLSEDQSTIALLKKEVIIARELTHDNIMKVFILGMSGNRHFIVMEYFAGQSLQDILDNSGKCSFDKAAAILVQVCDALQYAHDRGIIHLDIKPANILVGPVGNVKLCDFGIARMAINNVTTATQRIITGSVGFMPPEQYRGRKFVSNRSDIYSLGASFYTAVTGEAPIGILDTEGIPSCVLRAMDRNPDNRYQSVEEFHNAFIEETGFERSASEIPRPRVTLTREAPAAAPVESRDDVTVQEAETPYQHAVAAVTPPVEPAKPSVATAPPTEPAVVATKPESTEETRADRPPASMPERVSKQGTLGSLIGKPIYAVVAIGLVAAVVTLLIVFTSGKDRTKGATETPGQTAKQAVSSESEGATESSAEQAGQGKPSLANVATTKADEETVKSVQSALDSFVELLNYSRSHQSYMCLSKDLRAQIDTDEFERIFFGSPRLWKAEGVEIGKTAQGKILVKLQFKIMDAFLGTVKTDRAAIELVRRDPGWKISDFDLGGKASRSRTKRAPQS